MRTETPCLAPSSNPWNWPPALDDPSWAIIDCRFELARPAWGASAFAAGHIPNAQYAHLDGDLSGARGAHTGRHPLPEVNELASLFGRLGIDAQVQVVAYDQGNGMYAARLWWLLRWLGHPQVAVLNGGFAAWERAGLPVSVRSVARAPRRFSARVDPDAVASSAQVAELVAQGALKRGERILVDARAADRFAGENETLDPIAGHVPGARNHPFATNLEATGAFSSRASCTSAGSARSPVSRPRARSPCAAPASPPATTCSRWRSPAFPGRACTRAPGASGSAIRRTPWRAGRSASTRTCHSYFTRILL